MKKLIILSLVLCLVMSTTASAVTIGARKGLATFDNTLVRGRLQVSGNATFGGTVAGTIRSTGVLTAAAGISETPTAKVAGTAIASPNAVIAAGTSMVQVTSAHADNLIFLPTPVVGHRITIICDPTTAFEIRPALQTQYINAVECTPNKELVAPAASIMHATAVVAGAAGKWIITQSDDDGTTDAGGTPD